MRRYHWVMTVQFWPAPGAVVTTWREGTFRPDTGQTREQAFDHLYKRTLAQAEADPRLQGVRLDNPVVTFFSLEPDEL